MTTNEYNLNLVWIIDFNSGSIGMQAYDYMAKYATFAVRPICSF